MAQTQQPQPPDQFNLPPGFTPSVQSTQPPSPYYGFEPPPPQPTIAPYQPTLGTQLLEKMWQAATGAFPGSEGVAGGPSAVIGPWYSKLEQVLANKMPKQAPAQQVRGIVQGGGVKPEEVEYSGVEDYLSKAPLASKEGLLQHIQQTRPKLEVQQRGGEYDINRLEEIKAILAGEKPLTDREAISLNMERQRLEEARESPTGKFSQYTLPGGENYRELLVTMPYEKKGINLKEGETLVDALDRERAASPVFSGGHFDEPNVLTHLRVNDRVTPDGKKVLFVEEVQSDWHQKGRAQGYQLPSEQTAPMDSEYRALVHKNAAAREAGREPLPSDVARAQALEDTLLRSDKSKIPDAPFKKSWPLLAMKQALAEAAKDGKDYVAWTTGAQQAERYDLSKQLSKIEYEKVDGGKRIGIGAFTPDGHEAISRTVSAEELPNLVGKDVADRILSSKQSSGELSGLDLKVGGEGMSSFYDKELVNELNKYAKQWGVKVQSLNLQTKQLRELEDDLDTVRYPGGRQHTVHALPITPRMREEILGKGQPLFSLGAGLAGGALAEKLAQPREQTFEQKETASHLTRMGKDVY